MTRQYQFDVWIRDSGGGALYEVRYGKYTLARFVRKELAVAYRDWFWARRGAFLKDTRLGRFTLEELLSARLPRR